MSTAAPVCGTWALPLAVFSSERIMEMLAVVKGECSNRCGDRDGGFGRLLARARAIGGIGRIILGLEYPN